MGGRSCLILADKDHGRVVHQATPLALVPPCSGAFLSQSFEFMAAAVLKGALSRLILEPVNLINAPVIAREMGLAVDEQRESDNPS